MGKIEIPEDLLPDKNLKEFAKYTDRTYKELHDALLRETEGATSIDIIELITTVQTEKIALIIGSNLPDYDKKVIYGVVERYIAGIVSSE